MPLAIAELKGMDVLESEVTSILRDVVRSWLGGVVFLDDGGLVGWTLPGQGDNPHQQLTERNQRLEEASMHLIVRPPMQTRRATSRSFRGLVRSLQAGLSSLVDLHAALLAGPRAWALTVGDGMRVVVGDTPDYADQVVAPARALLESRLLNRLRLLPEFRLDEPMPTRP